MTDYQLCLNNIDDDLAEAFKDFSYQYWTNCKDEKTIENIVKSYKYVVIGIIRYINSDIKDILINRNITDPGTQQRITEHYIEHINTHIESIIEPIIDKFGVYSVEGNNIVVDFHTDFGFVKSYMADVHAQALDATIFEMGTMFEKQIISDCEHLEALYKLIRTSQDKEKDVAEYCHEKDANLLEKYGPIIFMMDQFGFRSNEFKNTMKFFSENMSLKYADVFKKYYKSTLRKDSNYKRNMSTVNKFITQWEDQMKLFKEREQAIRDSAKNAKREQYRSWIN